MAGLFTVFVDNLPKSMNVGWLRQLFNPFGCVKDVFIPNKRSSFYNTKFGFVRFKKREEASSAIEDLDGIVIRNLQLLCSLQSTRKLSLVPLKLMGLRSVFWLTIVWSREVVP